MTPSLLPLLPTTPTSLHYGEASPLDLSFGVSSFISRTTSDSGTSASGTEIRCTKSSISCIQEDMTLVFLEASV
ncbi:hypothetical protein M9434_000161 [Picochlorum sp. BPE23]|nr:hypothetical protein M9434_000161 [Picochlorum sp. BPE23]